MNNISRLQGTPWHSETMHRTCKDGSKYCLYIHNDGSCGCISSINHKKKCIGKGSCEDFESKGVSLIPVSKKKNIVSTYHPERSKKIEKAIKEKKAKREMDNKKTERTNEKKDNFLRLSQDRVNKILKDMESLEKLSNRNNYSYTDEQIDKMFNAISNQLQESKKSFENKKSSGKFEW